MGIEEALEVLNRRSHRGSDTWERVRGFTLRRGEMVRPSMETPSPGWLDAFEAVAVAEKYLREESRGNFEETMPARGEK